MAAIDSHVEVLRNIQAWLVTMAMPIPTLCLYWLCSVYSFIYCLDKVFTEDLTLCLGPLLDTRAGWGGTRPTGSLFLEGVVVVGHKAHRVSFPRTFKGMAQGFHFFWASSKDCSEPGSPNAWDSWSSSWLSEPVSEASPEEGELRFSLGGWPFPPPTLEGLAWATFPSTLGPGLLCPSPLPAELKAFS